MMVKRHLSVVILFSTLALAMLSTTSVPAISLPIPTVLARWCQNGASIRAAHEAATEAWALNDDDKKVLAKEAARQFFRCAHSTDQPLTRDWARLMYSWWYLRSFETTHEFLQHAQQVYDTVNDVEASTKSGDVRKFAASLRSWLTRSMQHAKANPSPF